jgi:tetratricopeptide (TPR) repeat protein
VFAIKPAGRAKVVAPPLLLATLAVAVFAGTVRNEFITLDDKSYIYDNPQVLRGFGWQTVLWALSSTENANWYPLRRLTHLADFSLFGLWAGGHHLASVAWHAAAAVLLFLSLRLMTGRGGRSFVVAALFAVHPLQVESVAWAAERSNVLAGFFFGLTLLLWAHYARRPGAVRFGAAALALALGLMAKPILMTTPLVLLLLDFWPLGRMHAPGTPPWRPHGSRFVRCLLEKLPLLALAGLSAAVSVAVHKQAEALPALEALPFAVRLGNALLSYWRYLGSMLWPASLAVYYPHPGVDLSAGSAIVAGVSLLALTAAVLVRAPRRPWLCVGWLWYLGSLVPMIGIVQFGSHAMADRFAYLPSVGCFIAAVWLSAEGLRALPARLAVEVAAVAVVLAALGATTMTQVRLWRNSRTLYEHSLAVTSGNWMMHVALGALDAHQERLEEAEAHFRTALRIRPLLFGANSQLGSVLVRKGKLAEGISAYERALHLRPDEAETWVNLGVALARAGRHGEAATANRRALAVKPGLTEGHMNLGNALSNLGRPAEALEAYAKALQLSPGRADIHYNRALVLERIGRAADASGDYREALRLDPGLWQAREGLARTEQLVIRR